jgi:putative transposase
MEQRRQIVNRFIQMGLHSSTALSTAGMSRSTYYYKPTVSKRGRTPSTHTKHVDGSSVSNEKIISIIEEELAMPFIDYGSNRMTLKLKNLGFIINPKKVYRLMKEKQLLYPKRLKANANRQFVRYGIPDPTEPFETIEIDIKYVYIHGDARTSYLITAIDTFTRMTLVWDVDYKMKASQVISLIIELIQKINRLYKPKAFYIRTDNGPQFIAKKLREAVSHLAINHEFIRPGTPQQNAHIESFHSTISRIVFRHYEFNNLSHARIILSEFYTVYNTRRIMSHLLGMTPVEFLEAWNRGAIGREKKGRKTKFFFKEKPNQWRGSSREDFLVQAKIKMENPIFNNP